MQQDVVLITYIHITYENYFEWFLKLVKPIEFLKNIKLIYSITNT